MFIGDILQRKDSKTNETLEGEYYLKVTGLKEGQSVVLNNGDFVSIKTPAAFFNGLQKIGKMSEIEVEERLKKTPDFVRLKADVNIKNVAGRLVKAVK